MEPLSPALGTNAGERRVTPGIHPSRASDGHLTRPWVRAYRAVRDPWDVVRWTRKPLDAVRVLLPLPRRWMDIRILNEGPVPDGEASAASLGSALGTLRNVLESEALVDGRVDYGRLPGSQAYVSLTERSRMLTRILPESFGSDAERIAFWLNLYNVLSIHGVVALGIRRSVMEIPSFFMRAAYRVGPYTFCLDDISNGVLRRAAPTPATGRRQFRSGDPRLAYCPTAVDPRIHGALVCAAASCPPVAFYAPEQLDTQLDLAAGNFVTQLVRIDPRRREVHLPLQFYYYVQDFGGAPGIAQFLLRHLAEPDHALMRQALDGRWRIRWDPYDWGLNGRA